MVLKILRKKGVMQKILWMITFGIILSFGIFWQTYSLNEPQGLNYAGKIFGKKIPPKEFERHYLLTQIEAMIQYPENYRQIKEYLNLEAKTWDRIILLHEAQKQKIKIPDQDVIKTIKENSLFQTNGQFDKRLYDVILRKAFSIRSRDFEEGIRENLKLMRLFEKQTAKITISNEEIFNAYKKKKEKIQISYILFSPENYTNQVTFDEDQAIDYYQKNKEKFQLPEMINVEYISFDYPENASKEDQENVYSTVQQVRTEVSQVADFQQVAAKFNLTVERSDFFSIEQPNLKVGWSYPILQKIFQLKVGEISEPLQTPKGFQILRILEKKDTNIPDYEETKDKVKEAWIKSQAKKIAQQKAEENLKLIQQTFQSLRRPDFVDIAKNQGLEIHQTPVFSRGEYLPKIGISRDFQEMAFSLNEERKLSEGIVETETGFCILHLDSRIPIDQKEFEKQKEAFSKTLLFEMKTAAFNDFLTLLRLRADLEDNISKLLDQNSERN